MSHESSPAAEELVIPVWDGVELRPLTLKNADEHQAAILRNQAHLKPWVVWAGDDFSEEINQQMLAKNEEGFANGTAYAMGIYVDGVLAGSTDIRGIGSPEGAEVGYWVDQEFVGRGLASGATESLINYVRARHDIPKIVLHTMVNNEASSRVAERLGFRYDGEVENNEVGTQEKRYVKFFE